jgi:hypothetical protein
MAISSIQIDVDQQTFQSWSLAMANLAQSFTVPINVVTAISGVTVPSSISFTGVELLNEVGRAATRPDAIDDPDRLFALFRYGTKVASQTPNFRLSTSRRIRDIHKSSVLSDEVGAGFALLFASRILGASIFLDLADAVRRRRITTPAPKSLVPDYVGLYGPNNSIIILEAKGTQTRGRCLSKQLPKGCTQVSSVSVPAGRATLRVVIGTELHRENQPHDTIVFVGDPDERQAYPFFEDTTPEAVAVREHYQRVASLIGDIALLKRTEHPEAAEAETRLVRRDVGNRVALGSTFELRSNEGTAGFFVGLDLEIREEILATLSSPTAERVPRVHPAAGKRRDKRFLSNYAIASDGSVMDMWFSGDFAETIAAE